MDDSLEATSVKRKRKTYHLQSAKVIWYVNHCEEYTSEMLKNIVVSIILTSGRITSDFYLHGTSTVTRVCSWAPFWGMKPQLLEMEYNSLDA